MGFKEESDGVQRESSDLETAQTELNGTNEGQTLEQMARKALECPCVADLRDGPCGKQFSEAFVCYVKSTAEEKGSDCIEPFLAMQACMAASPELFTKLEDDGGDPHVGEGPRERRPSSKSKSKRPPPPTAAAASATVATAASTPSNA